jgi:hypothetical protein
METTTAQKQKYQWTIDYISILGAPQILQYANEWE